jgi:hypothetical protein
MSMENQAVTGTQVDAHQAINRGEACLGRSAGWEWFVLWSSLFGHVDGLFGCDCPLVCGVRQVAQGRVAPKRVVEAEDVVGVVLGCLAVIGVVALPQVLGLQVPEEGLGLGVVRQLRALTLMLVVVRHP